MTAHKRSVFTFVGSAPASDDAGIHTFRFDTGTGELVHSGHCYRTENPSFLALDPVNCRLYAVGERETGMVKAFAIDPDSGELALINTQTTGGAGPCHVAIDSRARVLLAANYKGGSVSSLPILRDGSIGPAASVIQHEGSSVVADRQGEPHPHSMVLSPDERYVFAQDLGIDKVMVYRLDAGAATLTPHDPASVRVAPGAGPRHFTFHPDGIHAYLINELANTVIVYEYDPALAVLGEVQCLSTLPPDFGGESYCAEIVVHPSGRFLYGSNRGHDSIATFRIDEGTGRLELTGLASTRGSFPRNSIIDATGAFMIVTNQKGNNIVVFAIDPDTGKLTLTGQELELPMPLGIRTLPAVPSR